MAGTWIIMHTNLFESPRVMAIEDSTGLDTYEIIGRLHRVWAWADEHTDDGTTTITEKMFDRIANHDGFAEAMVLAGWLEFDDDGFVRYTNFDEHNGKTAKRRAKDAKRNAGKRTKNGDSQGESTKRPQSVRNDADEKRTTCGATKEKKTKQDISEGSKSAAVAAPRPPADFPPEFESWWKSYPTRPGASRGSKTQSHTEWARLTTEQREQLVKATANLAKSDTFPKDAQRFLKPERGDTGGDPVWVGWINLEPSSGLSRKNDRNTYGQDAESKADLLARMKSSRQQTVQTEVRNAS